MTYRLYQAYASALLTIKNCENTGKPFPTDMQMRINKLNELMPHGSGLDGGSETRLLRNDSSSEKLVFPADFHHMNEHGFYDRWSYHRVIVTPSLLFGIILKVTGRDRNDIKDHIYQVFYDALMQEVE